MPSGSHLGHSSGIRDAAPGRLVDRSARDRWTGPMPDDFQQMWRDLAPVGRSASSGGYFRQPWTSAESELRAWFAEECAARGLVVETDGIGNQVAWWEPPAGARPGDKGVL